MSTFLRNTGEVPGRMRICAVNMTGNKTTWLVGQLLHPENAAAGIMAYQPRRIYDETGGIIRARTGAEYRGALPWDQPEDLLAIIDTRNGVLALDEAHFLEQDEDVAGRAVEVLLRIRNTCPVLILLTALKQDFRRVPFMSIAHLMAHSELVQMPEPGCKVAPCSNPGLFPQRLQMGQPVPATDPRFLPNTPKYHELQYTYEPRCGLHHVLPLQLESPLARFRQLLETEEKYFAYLEELRTELQRVEDLDRKRRTSTKRSRR